MRAGRRRGRRIHDPMVERLMQTVCRAGKLPMPRFAGNSTILPLTAATAAVPAALLVGGRPKCRAGPDLRGASHRAGIVDGEDSDVVRLLRTCRMAPHRLQHAGSDAARTSVR